MTNAEVLHQVDHGYRMQCPQGCPRALYDIMLECWHKDPVKRPTFETLQWKLEDFFTMSDSEYRDATAYWLNYSLLSLLQACLFVWHLWQKMLLQCDTECFYYMLSLLYCYLLYFPAVFTNAQFIKVSIGKFLNQFFWCRLISYSLVKPFLKKSVMLNFSKTALNESK